ncbi:MAG: hypothetical protein ACREEE_07300 [Dongiaceae bacterium]
MSNNSHGVGPPEKRRAGPLAAADPSENIDAASDDDSNILAFTGRFQVQSRDLLATAAARRILTEKDFLVCDQGRVFRRHGHALLRVEPRELHRLAAEKLGYSFGRRALYRNVRMALLYAAFTDRAMARDADQ